ncbi:NLR, CARD domain-containing protein 3 [Pycnococcus provasolii]
MSRWGPPPRTPLHLLDAEDRKLAWMGNTTGTDNTGAVVVDVEKREGSAPHRLGRVPRLHAVDVRRRVRNVGDDLRKQLEQSWCEVNLAPLAVDELCVLGEALASEGSHLQCLRLVAESRGNFLLSSRAHRSIVAHVANNLADPRVAKAVPRSIALAVLASENLTDLELGASLGMGGMRAVGNAIGHNQTLQRVSFAGACIGDAGMLALHRGLSKNASLEELIVSGCQLTDKSATLVASVVKAHAATRSLMEWRQTLRKYPKGMLPQDGQATAYIDDDMDGTAEEVGGLLLLDVSDNLLTDKGAKPIIESLALDVNLLILSLRNNRMTLSTEILVHEALSQHPSLTRVDLRGNVDFMGVSRGASVVAQESAQALAVARAHEAAAASTAGSLRPAFQRGIGHQHAVQNVPRDAAILELADENRVLRHQLRQLTETAGKLFTLAESRGLSGAVAPPPRRTGGAARARVTVDSRPRTRARAGSPAIQTKAMRSAEVDLVGKLTRALRRLEHVVDGFAAETGSTTPSRVAFTGSANKAIAEAQALAREAAAVVGTPGSARRIGVDTPIRGSVVRQLESVSGIVDDDGEDDMDRDA